MEWPECISLNSFWLYWGWGFKLFILPCLLLRLFLLRFWQTPFTMCRVMRPRSTKWVFVHVWQTLLPWTAPTLQQSTRRSLQHHGQLRLNPLNTTIAERWPKTCTTYLHFSTKTTANEMLLLSTANSASKYLSVTQKHNTCKEPETTWIVMFQYRYKRRYRLQGTDCGWYTATQLAVFFSAGVQTRRLDSLH